jgi:hypothetical protein
MGIVVLLGGRGMAMDTEKERGGLPTGWSLEVTAAVIEVVYKHERSGWVNEYTGVCNLVDRDSILRFMQALDSPRAISGTEIALKRAVEDSAQTWHHALNQHRRRPRVAAAPQPAAAPSPPPSGDDP